MWGRRCHHFDFGASLRAAAEGKAKDSFSTEDIRFIRDVLNRGRLLENKTFYLAAKIFHAFVVRRAGSTEDLLLLNGLPRHVGQAQDMNNLANVQSLIHLQCDAVTVSERLRLDSGGDRAERNDDEEELVAFKLKTFYDRTKPLLDYYQQRGVEIHSKVMRVETQPEDVAKCLSRSAPRTGP